VRTREGAFIVVKCNEAVTRELYTGTEECTYTVGKLRYRGLVGIGTFLLMISVILLGNCNWTMQAAVGASYVILNGLFWGAALVDKKYSWDMSYYICNDVTPPYAKDAEHNSETDHSKEGTASYTRTMWYAIRETKATAWVNKSGAAPKTPEWERWLDLAEANKANLDWGAVAAKDEVVGTDNQINNPPNTDFLPAEQKAPATEIPPEKRK